MRAPNATWGKDAVAGLVLGVQSVPDGVATGLLAGVNPLYGLNAYLVGTVTGRDDTIGAHNVSRGTERVGAASARAHGDALEWIAAQSWPGGTDQP
ncbi:MAG: hypothetical protein HGA44_23430 [Cellulomonadaceae bacterium]|nr:hypothetical protein [Cellulomonadaceae bacterium]